MVAKPAQPRVKRSVVPKPVVGWREYLVLDELSEHPMKTKVDTGARTSALHAFRLKVHEIEGIHHATFEVHPHQRSARDANTVTVPVRTFKKVKSSNGKVELRPVIRTLARLGDTIWPIDITLTSREEMGFRMLLGRAAVTRRFLVDPGRSFLLSKHLAPPKKGTAS